MNFLKPYRKFLDYDIDKCGKVYLNINNTENNIYHILPLNEYANCDISNISLIWKMNNLTLENGIFGYNTRLSLYKHFTLSGNTITVSYPDFEDMIFTFNSDNKYVNLLTNDYIIKDSYNNYLYYDVNGNYYKYENGYDYPKYYYNKCDNRQIQICYFNNNRKLSAIYGINGCNIILTYTNNLVTNISVKRILDIYDEEELSEVILLNIDIEYANNNIVLVNYTYLKDNKTYVIEKESFINNESIEYIFSDSKTNKKLKITLNQNNKITSVRETYNNSFANTSILYFSYYNNYTKIYSNESDTEGNRIIENYYYFDSNNKLIYSFTKDGLIRYREYNDDNLLTYDSNILYTHKDAKLKENNLIINGDFLDNLSNFNVSGSGISVISTTSFPPFLSNKVVLFNSSNIIKSISQLITFNYYKTDTLTLSLFYKYSNAGSAYVKVLFFNDEEDEGIIINLDKHYQNDTLFISKTLKPSKSYTNVKISIVCNVSTYLEVSSISLYPLSSASIYNYDEDNNIISVENNDRTTDYEYNSDNKLESTLSAYSSNTSYTYDNRGRIEKVDYPHSVKKITTYSKKNTPTNIKTYFSNSENYIEESHTYYNHLSYSLANNYKLHENDTCNNNIDYVYDFSYTDKIYDKALHNPTIIDDGLLQTNYKYNFKEDVNEVKFINKNLPSQNIKSSSLLNDNFKTISEVAPLNNKYQYEYYGYSGLGAGNIKKISYENGTNVVPLTNLTYARINDINTSLIESRDNGTTYTKYIYDNYYNLKEIKIDNILKHKFTYDYLYNGNKLLSTETYFNNNTYKCEYDYDKEERIKSYKIKYNNNIREQIKYDYNDTYLVSKDYGSHILNYSSKEKMTGVNIESAKYYFYNSNIPACFFDNSCTIKSMYGDISPYSYTGTFFNQSFINYIYNPRIHYVLDNSAERCISLYFSHGSGTILSLGSRDLNDHLSIRINNDRKVELRVHTNIRSEFILMQTTNEIYYDKWNYLNIRHTNLNSERYKITFTVNNESYKYENDSCDYINISNNDLYIGYKYKRGQDSEFLTGSVSFLSVENGYISNTINLAKYILDENVYHNLYMNENNDYYNSVSVVSDVAKNLSNGTDLIPLSDSFKSIKGKSPFKQVGLPNILLDKDPNFNYNSISKSYNYEARGTTLIYNVKDVLDVDEEDNLDYLDINLNIFPTINNTNQIIMEFKFNSRSIKIGVNESNYLYIKDLNSQLKVLIY